jgi:hypothetical protein
VVQATEEAIINAMVAAKTMTGRDHNTATGIMSAPGRSLLEIMEQFHRLKRSTVTT